MVTAEIDLDFTYSCVSVLEREKVVLNANVLERVLFTDYEVLIGDAAKSQTAGNPSDTVYGKIFSLLTFKSVVYFVGSVTKCF